MPHCGVGTGGEGRETGNPENLAHVPTLNHFPNLDTVSSFTGDSSCRGSHGGGGGSEGQGPCQDLTTLLPLD